MNLQKYYYNTNKGDRINKKVYCNDIEQTSWINFTTAKGSFERVLPFCSAGVRPLECLH